MSRKVVIVGGVGGGMSCAARLRRLDEQARIVVLEQGPHASFANCGLPYNLGGEIAERSKLVVQSAEILRSRFAFDLRVKTRCTAIDRAARKVTLRDLDSGQETQEDFDYLVLAPGANPVRLDIPGLDRPGNFVLRNIPDLTDVSTWIDLHHARRAVVVGGGYVGVETAEQLRRRGLEVALIEALPQIMTPFDPELAVLLEAELRRNGVRVHLGNPVAEFVHSEGATASRVVLTDGTVLDADVVILGLGVRPNVELAQACGLELGGRGGINVNDRMQTSDERIYAVGDAVEVRDFVTGEPALVPLAGPANRQGRIAADNICARHARYSGTLGTAIVRVFELAGACCGANEKTLQRLNQPHSALHLHPLSHAGYFPGAKPIALKLLFSPETRKVLGAQAVGGDGVDKRIDVIAAGIKAGFTVDDLAELELCYAPPFGSAKDPVNLAGMAAQNVLDGLVAVSSFGKAAEAEFILDVRESAEVKQGAIPGSVNIPLGQLRTRLDELPREKQILVHCQSGQRSYYACRILSQHGFRVSNLSGSYKTWNSMNLGDQT